VVSGDTRYLPTENVFSRFVVMIMKSASGMGPVREKQRKGLAARPPQR
jgi:hypothetical protein